MNSVPWLRYDDTGKLMALLLAEMEVLEVVVACNLVVWMVKVVAVKEVLALALMGTTDELNSNADMNLQKKMKEEKSVNFNDARFVFNKIMGNHSLPCLVIFMPKIIGSSSL